VPAEALVVGKELRGEGERNAQGEREGRGTMVYPSGNMYEGQWRAGEMHGQGKYSSATGDVYEGGWVEDEMHGQGKYSFATGNVTRASTWRASSTAAAR
jgi:hypothetical protein